MEDIQRLHDLIQVHTLGAKADNPRTFDGS